MGQMRNNILKRQEGLSPPPKRIKAVDGIGEGCGEEERE